MCKSEPQAAYEFLCKIKQDLKTKNRFSCDPRFDQAIDLYAQEDFFTSYIDSGSILYRARIYNEPDAEARYDVPPKGRFKGYNAKDSFVNLNNDCIGEGRCNPSYIPYLYTAKSEKCCIYEVRPSKGAYVSVARIKVSEPLKILHFEYGSALSTSGDMVLDGVFNSLLFLYLANEFSQPHKEFGDYLLCQYASERVKRLGFDGISYKSSVCPNAEKRKKADNINVLIFNYEKCKAVSSKLYRVEEVNILYG